ncbi:MULTISPECIES: hypothetical protein [unclassified Clostridium]|uniref:hypothetical protein n=1 Tax=unclassified Clostridium TaxID=2614128 RepID=UPI000298320A|nr:MULTISPECIES: hypothetical protein [unclassified Clostridium]EKQ53725.1 MAG: hypothetical protein A370_03470 [Clostridium sp. Maddingley MBC34-26]
MAIQDILIINNLLARGQSVIEGNELRKWPARNSGYVYNCYPDIWGNEYSTVKCDSNDYVMYVIGGERYVIFHLTYFENIDVSYPHFILFENLQKALSYIEKRYLEEYM